MSLRPVVTVENKKVIKQFADRGASLLFRLADLAEPGMVAHQERAVDKAKQQAAIKIVQRSQQFLASNTNHEGFTAHIPRLARNVGTVATADSVGQEVERHFVEAGITDLVFDRGATLKASQIKTRLGYGNPEVELPNPAGPTMVISRVVPAELVVFPGDIQEQPLLLSEAA